jgi:hypothetical protein
MAPLGRGRFGGEGDVGGGFGRERAGRGRGRGRDRGNYGRGRSTRGDQGFCRNSQQTGRGRLGENRSHSHDKSLGSTSKAPPPRPRERPEETPEQQKARSNYHSWRRLIKSSPRPNDIVTIELLWNGALEILDGDDREWKQMLPRDLDNEDYCGREHIRTLLDMKSHMRGHDTYVDLTRPFLFVITHTALLDCLSVDTAVGGLYNFISGTNGSRAVPFFQRLSKILAERHFESSTVEPTANLEKTLSAVLIAIRELLRREVRAAFHEDLSEVVNSIEHITEVCGLKEHSVTAQVVFDGIRELRGMIARANHLLHHEEEPSINGVSTTVVTSTYPREINLPRDRHDNDKIDFTKIKILPTEDEIRSNHPEFLPSTELDQPHFLIDRAGRHLDTLFRLLRYDIFGELKEALGQLMVALESDPTLVENPKLSLGNIRAYPIPKAHVRYVTFDQRRGLEAQITFPQPLLLRKKSSAERCKWWQETKRLEEGTLLCLLSANKTKTSLLFFTVAEKCTDMKKEYSLSSDNAWATILTRLATREQADLELLIRLSCQNTWGVLIELPGVVLATFIPILENLQDMQRSSRLPYRQWILPVWSPIHGDVSKQLDIPPAVYARSPGFVFSLKSVLKDPDDDLSVSSRASTTDSALIDELEARTVLDRGQCVALVAALTREFAFIQGPPGTGKSFLGVQLMKVLLDSKENCDIGPVVVV